MDEEGDGEVFNIIDDLLGELGDTLHAISNMPYAAVRSLMDEGKTETIINQLKSLKVAKFKDEVCGEGVGEGGGKGGGKGGGEGGGGGGGGGSDEGGESG